MAKPRGTTIKVSGPGCAEVLAALTTPNPKELALRNIMLLAMKRLHKGSTEIADWEAVLRFCKEGGIEPSPLRASNS